MPGTWTFENAQTSFAKYQDIWKQLAERLLGCRHPLADIDYVSPLLEHFGDSKVILALRDGTGERGMALLTRDAPGIWSSFTPGTGPFNFALIESDGARGANDAVDTLIHSLPGYAVLLGFNKLDPLHLTVNLRTDERVMDRMDYFETLRIPTNRVFDDYWSERSKNLKRNIIKKSNRLKNAGIAMHLREIADPQAFPAAVAAYGDIEARGWKGKAGSAVGVDPNSDRFYNDMLTRFAARDAAAIYQLVFDDKAVASAITVKGCGMIIILKIAYDEQFSDYSPGLLMMYELHRRIFDMNDIDVIEYYGKATSRAQQWAVTLRMLFHVNYYRNPMARRSIVALRTLRNRLRN